MPIRTVRGLVKFSQDARHFMLKSCNQTTPAKLNSFSSIQKIFPKYVSRLSYNASCVDLSHITSSIIHNNLNLPRRPCSVWSNASFGFFRNLSFSRNSDRSKTFSAVETARTSSYAGKTLLQYVHSTTMSSSPIPSGNAVDTIASTSLKKKVKKPWKKEKVNIMVCTLSDS